MKTTGFTKTKRNILVVFVLLACIEVFFILARGIVNRRNEAKGGDTSSIQYINLMSFPEATGDILKKAESDFKILKKISVDDIPLIEPNMAVIQGDRLLLHFLGTDSGNTDVFCFDTSGNFLYGYSLACADYTGIGLPLKKDSFLAVSYRVYPATIAEVDVNDSSILYYYLPEYSFGDSTYSFYYDSDWKIIRNKNGILAIANHAGEERTIYDHSKAFEEYERKRKERLEKDHTFFEWGLLSVALILVGCYLVVGLIEQRRYISDSLKSNWQK